MKIKNIALSIGTIGAVVTPITVIVSCGSTSEFNKQISKEEYKKLGVTTMDIRSNGWPDGDSPSLVSTTATAYRFSGFDTPEVHDQFNEFKTLDLIGKNIEYYYGLKAKTYVESIFPNSIDILDLNGKDIYKRKLAVAFDPVQRLPLNTIMIKEGMARRAYTNSDVEWQKWDAEAYKSAFDNKKGFWKFVIDGTIPSDAPQAFINEANALEDYPFDRLKAVFNKINSFDGSIPGWLDSYFAKHGGVEW